MMRRRATLCALALVLILNGMPLNAFAQATSQEQQPLQPMPPTAAFTAATEGLQPDASGHYKVTIAKHYELNDALGTILDHTITPDMTREQQLWAVYRHVVDDYRYKTLPIELGPGWIEQKALDMYRDGSGHCFSFATLFGLLARALGYEVRFVRGGYITTGGHLNSHGWVELTLDGRVWLIDPDGEHELKEPRWFFTYDDYPEHYRRILVYP